MGIGDRKHVIESSVLYIGLTEHVPASIRFSEITCLCL
jgi:hypothetical protein